MILKGIHNPYNGISGAYNPVQAGQAYNQGMTLPVFAQKINRLDSGIKNIGQLGDINDPLALAQFTDSSYRINEIAPVSKGFYDAEEQSNPQPRSSGFRGLIAIITGRNPKMNPGLNPGLINAANRMPEGSPRKPFNLYA